MIIMAEMIRSVMILWPGTLVREAVAAADAAGFDWTTYDQDGDFRKSIKNRESQERLQAQESIIKTDEYRRSAIEDAKEAMSQDPNLPRNIFNMAEALSDLQKSRLKALKAGLLSFFSIPFSSGSTNAARKGPKKPNPVDFTFTS
jgi:hypothetical protein